MEEVKTKTCKGPLCEGKEHPLTDFPPKGTQCKKCVCHKTKEYYKLNNRSYRKAKNLIKEKGSCTECGCNDIRLLEFDHLENKNFNICHSFSAKNINEEVKLTQILCVWCHRNKTRELLDSIKEKNNDKFNITMRPENTEDGKKCYGLLCKRQLQFKNNFYSTAKICKVCMSYKSRVTTENNRNYVIELKLEHKHCEICKIEVTKENSHCFDFDHLRDKIEAISHLARRPNDTRTKILEESKKCRLLCCKCHRIHTADQLGYNFSTT